jgi:hypothetical protein
VLDSSFTPIAGNASRLALDEGRQGIGPDAWAAIPDGCRGSSARAGRTGTIWTCPVFLTESARRSGNLEGMVVRTRTHGSSAFAPDFEIKPWNLISKDRF